MNAFFDPADVARSIVFAIDRPPHVQIAEMMILPVTKPEGNREK